MKTWWILGSLFLSLLLLILHPRKAIAATIADTFRITSDGSQQSGPLIYRNLIVYTNFGGSEGIDIWGYNLWTSENFPIIEREGTQFLTGFYRNLIIYEDTPLGEVTTDVRMYNLWTGEDSLIAGGPGSQTSGVTNGKHVVYIDGGACGSLHTYSIWRGTTEKISNTACHPVRVWRNIVIWSYASPGGTNVYGYDLRRSEQFDVATADGFQETPNIYRNNVVWLQRLSGAYGDYNAIVAKNLRTGRERVIYESSTNTLNWPAVSYRYVVWSESSAQHVGGVKAADLRTGEVFEVQEQGPHQNSHTMPAIWRNIAAWQAWRTGNGDIYGSIFSFAKPVPPVPPAPPAPPSPPSPPPFPW